MVRWVPVVRQHVVVDGVVEGCVVSEVDPSRMVVGVEPLRPIAEGNATLHRVHRGASGRGRGWRTIAACLEPRTVARGAGRVRNVAIAKREGGLDDAGTRGVDEVEAVVTVVEDPAATHHVVAPGSVATDPIPTASSLQEVVVVVGVAVENEVVGAAGDEDPRGIVVVHIQVLEDVATALDPNAPGVRARFILMHSRYLETAEMDEAYMHVEARHAIRGGEAGQIEDRRLTGVGEVTAGRPLGSAPLEGDSHCSASREGEGAAPDPHRVTRVRHLLGIFDGSEGVFQCPVAISPGGNIVLGGPAGGGGENCREEGERGGKEEPFHCVFGRRLGKVPEGCVKRLLVS